MPLPLLNTFDPPFEIWNERNPTLEEMIANGSREKIRVTKLGEIGDAKSAAVRIASIGHDPGLAGHIQKVLSGSPIYKTWRAEMPSKTPSQLSVYQKDMKGSDLSAVSAEITNLNKELSIGQQLFHAGHWEAGANVLTTDRPLSTSLCPQVALRNAEFKGKAYDAGRLDLWVLRVARAGINGFVFRPKGTKLGHESEVLLAHPVNLKVIADDLVRSDYPVSKVDYPAKVIPIHVLTIDVS